MKKLIAFQSADRRWCIDQKDPLSRFIFDSHVSPPWAYNHKIDSMICESNVDQFILSDCPVADPASERGKQGDRVP